MRYLNQLQPEYRHFARNAAEMLRNGRSEMFVAESALKLGLNAEQVVTLLGAAQEILEQETGKAGSQGRAGQPGDDTERGPRPGIVRRAYTRATRAMRGDGFVSTAGVAVAMLPATLAMRYVFPLDPWWLWGAYAFFMVGGLSAVTGIASYALAEVRWNWQNLQWRIFAVLTVAASLAVSGLIRLIGTPCVAGCPFSSVVP